MGGLATLWVVSSFTANESYKSDHKEALFTKRGARVLDLWLF